MAKLKRAPLWDTTRPTIEEEDDNTQEAPTTAKLKKIDRTWVIIIERADGTRNDYRFTTEAKATRWARLAGLDLELEEVARLELDKMAGRPIMRASGKSTPPPNGPDC